MVKPMATIDIYNDELSILRSEMNGLTRDLSVLRHHITTVIENVKKSSDQIYSLIQSSIGKASVATLYDELEELKVNLESQNAPRKESKTEMQIENMLNSWTRLKSNHNILSQKLEVVCGDIDKYLASLQKRLSLKKNKIKNHRARDIATVSWLDSKLGDMQRQLKNVRNEVKAAENERQRLDDSYPSPIINILVNLNSLLEGQKKSAENIEKYRFYINQTYPEIPVSISQWLESLNTKLIEREIDLAPNLPLSTGELRIFTSNLFDNDLDIRRNAIQQIERERNATKKLMDDHIDKLDFHHFDIGLSSGKNKKKKSMPSQKIKNLLEKSFYKILDVKTHTEYIKGAEKHHKLVSESVEKLISSATTSTKRHLKGEPFSILLITSRGMKPSSYLKAYKKSWHIYPNYHLCHEEIQASDKNQRTLDILVKLPISSKLFRACLSDELTQDQAMILQNIDIHDDLLQLLHSHQIPLELIFALDSQEGKYWLNALLANPKMYLVIEEHRHDPFDERLWDLVLQKSLKPWQYACMVRLNFNGENALETLLLSENPWDELNEFAALYNVEDELKQLIDVYQPKNISKNSSSTLSLSDVMKIVDPISEYTVNKSIAPSKKVKRRRRGRYSF